MEVLVTDIELDHALSTGIRWAGYGDEIVAFQEEQEARLERGIDLETWGRMATMEKALLVAVRRNQAAIQNIRNEAEIQESEKNMRRAKRGR